MQPGINLLDLKFMEYLFLKDKTKKICLKHYIIQNYSKSQFPLQLTP